VSAGRSQAKVFPFPFKCILVTVHFNSPRQLISLIPHFGAWNKWKRYW